MPLASDAAARPVPYAVPGFIALGLGRTVAGALSAWVRQFRAFESPRYGIVRNLGSFNLLWAASHEWIGIARDVWRAPGLRAKLCYLVMPPGWSHDGSRDTSETIKARWRERVGKPEWKKPTSSSSGADRAARRWPDA